MNKEYKPVNNTFREHWKLHGYLSPTMIEELLAKVDTLDGSLTTVEQLLTEAEKGADYWREKYEAVM